MSAEYTLRAESGLGGMGSLLGHLWRGRTKYLLGAICLALCAIMLAPLVLSISASLKTTQEAAAIPPTYLTHQLSLDSYAQVTGVHPELVRRLVALGLLEVTRDAQGRLWFDPSQVREMARIQRLRMSLNLGYSAIGLVVELLDRIAELEKTQRRMSRRGGAPWT